ncbi:MAG: alpha/beta hydrolase, partial [Chitinophagaceae bacterium]|nr:alpha/beta hydrolase [Chitinophagaceae bacterium]
MKRFLRIVVLSLLVVMVISAVFIFKPAHFQVTEAQERPGTKYWQLSTGSKIAYTLARGQGKRKPFPIIYLHGGPGAGITNKEVETLGKLSEDGYDVYLYDQIGCGLSGRLDNIKEYSPQRHKNDLAEIIKNINAEKVILAGQSWGSILALSYLAENPDKVEKLIITAPGNIQPVRKEPGNIAAPDSIHLRSHYIDKRYELIAKNIRARAIIYAAKNLNKKLAGDKEADALLTYLTTELNRSMVCDTANAVIAEGTEGFYSHYMTLKQLNTIKDPRSALKNIHIPVLIMKGECDIQP